MSLAMCYLCPCVKQAVPAHAGIRAFRSAADSLVSAAAVRGVFRRVGAAGVGTRAHADGERHEQNRQQPHMRVQTISRSWRQ